MLTSSNPKILIRTGMLEAMLISIAQEACIVRQENIFSLNKKIIIACFNHKVSHYMSKLLKLLGITALIFLGLYSNVHATTRMPDKKKLSQKKEPGLESLPREVLGYLGHVIALQGQSSGTLASLQRTSHSMFNTLNQRSHSLATRMQFIFNRVHGKTPPPKAIILHDEHGDFFYLSIESMAYAAVLKHSFTKSFREANWQDYLDIPEGIFDLLSENPGLYALFTLLRLTNLLCLQKTRTILAKKIIAKLIADNPNPDNAQASHNP
jgi:hypothetical protein